MRTTRRQLGRVLKLIPGLLTVSLLILLLLSLAAAIDLPIRYSSRSMAILRLGRGSFTLAHASFSHTPHETARAFQESILPALLISQGPRFRTLAWGIGAIWAPCFHSFTGCMGQYNERSKTFTAWTCVVPLWIPFLAVALPTAIWSGLGCRPKAGHCKSCGYNLTGNVSGVCPECGTACGAR